MNWYKTFQEQLLLNQEIPILKEIVFIKKVHKFAYLSKSHQTGFANSETNDGYRARIELTENKNKITLSCRFLSDVYSFALFEDEWHYDKKEIKRALKTFNRIVNVIEDLKMDFEDDETPGPTLQGKAREELRFIDIDRKKPLNNRSLEAARYETGESDWRSSLYGNRYPSPAIVVNNNGVVNFHGKQI
jgi:hypothetical protein